jgi:fused signal recognition particle receptor
MVEDVEEVLFTADIGPRVAQDIIQALEERLDSDQKNDPGQVWGFIRTYTEDLLTSHEEKLDTSTAKPFVIMVVGVNGVGKTTTIGKMASRFRREGKSVLLVAGDTFRAAAVDQLKVWADRTELPMHAGEEGADPASVVYEGVERAIDEEFDVVICDTSGRLHTDKNLMEELSKMERVAGKAMEGAPHEVNLVLDANTGQNAIQQAENFSEALDVTGFTLTKFDGTARGGVILGVCKRFDAPVRYIGIGERVVDLREFDAHEFTEALFM